MRKIWPAAMLVVLLLGACYLIIRLDAGEGGGGSASAMAAIMPGSAPLTPQEIHSVHAPLGIPAGASETNDLIFRHTYTASSNDQTKFADWVAYAVTRAWLADSSDPGRNYRTDPFLDAEETLEERSGSGDYDEAYATHGYDRGHLVPLGSFHGSPFAEEVNFLSVLAPQISALNRGTWKSLETAVRRLVEHTGTAYVLAGPYYDTGELQMPLLPGADESHSVPTGYWMIVYQTQDPVEADSAPNLCSFLVPQRLPPGQGSERFVTTVDELEELTGLDFLALLADDVETTVEATSGTDWFVTW